MMDGVKTILIGGLAAFLEIAGCFSFWAWRRLDHSPLWLLPGVVCLTAFAFLLTLLEPHWAGRSFAGYGGLYIISALIWMAYVEDQNPDLWDLGGAGLCLLGAGLILFGPRG